MKILAIETSTITGSIALLDDAKGLIGEVRTDVKIVHAERLMPSIQWLLDTSRVSIDEIDAFGVSIGPGSFTGLRIGLSTVKGFAYASGKPIVPVPTLDAFAMTIPFCSHLICPMLDARKNEVYTALYKWEKDSFTKVLPETAVDPAAFAKQINGPVVLMGEGARKYQEILRENMKTSAIFAPASRMSPSAATVAEAALDNIRNGVIADAVGLVPLYIRKSEAELKWKG